MSAAVKALFEKSNRDPSNTLEDALFSDKATREVLAKLDEKDSLPVLPWSKQRYKIDLAEQQAECELNYARLKKLLKDLAIKTEWCFEIGVHGGQTRFSAKIIDRAPYTTTIFLSQQFVNENPSSILQSPSITVCMYHDASMAEVVAWKNHRRLRARYEYPNKEMYQRDEKVQLNKFLGDWLVLCQKKGRVLLNYNEMGLNNIDRPEG